MTNAPEAESSLPSNFKLFVKSIYNAHIGQVSLSLHPRRNETPRWDDPWFRRLIVIWRDDAPIGSQYYKEWDTIDERIRKDTGNDPVCDAGFMIKC